MKLGTDYADYTVFFISIVRFIRAIRVIRAYKISVCHFGNEFDAHKADFILSIVIAQLINRLIQTVCG